MQYYRYDRFAQVLYVLINFYDMSVKQNLPPDRLSKPSFYAHGGAFQIVKMARDF